MYVALPRVVMLLSELFIIYLAAAAPFGVSRFLSERAKGARTGEAIMKGACAALAWPFTSLNRLLRRAGARASRAQESSDARGRPGHDVERLTRGAVNSLREVEDVLTCAGVLEGASARHALYAARECVERYAGLALACAWADAEAAPTPREMELCRLAGRAGDDLLVAGRCVHRRNVTRLLAHRERARAELIRSLSEVRGIAERMYAPPCPAGLKGQAAGAEAGRLPAALSDAFSKVVGLLSLFGDEATASSVVRLLEDGRARAAGTVSRTGAASHAAAQEGGESCTTPAVPTAFATQRLRT